MKKQSKMVKCPICGKFVRARGLYGHMKLKDHLSPFVVTRVDGSNVDDSSDNSSDTGVKVIDSGNKSPIEKHDSDYTRVEGNSISEITEAAEAKLLNSKLTDSDKKKVSMRPPSEKSVDIIRKAEKPMAGGSLEPGFWGIFTEDRKTYKPIYRELLKFYLERPEYALRRWEHLKWCQEKYGWASTQSTDSCRALQEIFGSLGI